MQSVKPGVLRKFVNGGLSLEQVLSDEGSLLQLGKVRPLDQYEVIVDISDGDIVITVLSDRQVFGMDVIKKNLLKEFNIVSVKKTSGGLTSKDLKVIQFKTPGDLQLEQPRMVGNPVPWKQEPIQGRFSGGGWST